MVKSLGKNPPSSKAKTTKKGKLDIAAETVLDNIIFSKNEYWAYYRLSNIAYDYQSLGSRRAITNDMNSAFISIYGERAKPLDCHLIVTSFPLDLDAWRQQNDRDVSSWGGNDEKYTKAMDVYQELLEANEFKEQVTFLGIKIGDRNSLDIDAMSIVEGGISAAVDIARKGINKVIGAKHNLATQQEEEYVKAKEEEFQQTIRTGPLKGRPATSEELLLLIKKQFYPDMPSPYIEIDSKRRYGTSDISLISGSEIKNGSRFMKFTQVIGNDEYVRYRACLSIAKMPEQSLVPDHTRPLVHLMQSTSASDFFMRFTIYSKDDIRKILNLAEKEAMDEVKNSTAAQSDVKATVSGGLPTEVAENLSSLQGIREFALANPYPWTVSTMHLTVEGSSEEEIRRKIAEIKQRYQSVDIVVTWPVGWQAKLFLEQMPGDFLRVAKYKQTATLSQVASSGFNYSSEVGDKIEPANIGRKRRR